MLTLTRVKLTVVYVDIAGARVCMGIQKRKKLCNPTASVVRGGGGGGGGIWICCIISSYKGLLKLALCLRVFGPLPQPK